MGAVCFLMRCCIALPLKGTIDGRSFRPSKGEIDMTTLSKRVDNWATRISTGGRDGLVLMVDVINHLAKERDWDALVRLIHKTDDNVRAPLRNLLRARFGDVMVEDKTKRMCQVIVDKSHATGFKVKLNWKGNFQDTNMTTVTWGIVVEAMKNKRAYNDKDMHKALRDVWGDEKPKTSLDYDAYAKRIASYVEEKEGNFFALLSKLETIAKERRAELVEAPKAPGAETLAA